MKAKIIKKEYYVAITEDGKEYYVDITDNVVKDAYDNQKEIHGKIVEDTIVDIYDDGTTSRSYSVYEKFSPCICKNCDCK
jgi:hypothetical protein